MSDPIDFCITFLFSSFLILCAFFILLVHSDGVYKRFLYSFPRRVRTVHRCSWRYTVCQDGLDSDLIVKVLSFDVFLSETSDGVYNEWTRLMRDGQDDLVRF